MQRTVLMVQDLPDRHGTRQAIVLSKANENGTFSSSSLIALPMDDPMELGLAVIAALEEDDADPAP